jgi:hypothetical protein
MMTKLTRFALLSVAALVLAGALAAPSQAAPPNWVYRRPTVINYYNYTPYYPIYNPVIVSPWYNGRGYIAPPYGAPYNPYLYGTYGSVYNPYAPSYTFYAPYTGSFGFGY